MTCCIKAWEEGTDRRRGREERRVSVLTLCEAACCWAEWGGNAIKRFGQV